MEGKVDNYVFSEFYSAEFNGDFNSRLCTYIPVWYIYGVSRTPYYPFTRHRVIISARRGGDVDLITQAIEIPFVANDYFRKMADRSLYRLDVN